MDAMRRGFGLSNLGISIKKRLVDLAGFKPCILGGKLMQPLLPKAASVLGIPYDRLQVCIYQYI